MLKTASYFMSSFLKNYFLPVAQNESEKFWEENSLPQIVNIFGRKLRRLLTSIDLNTQSPPWSDAFKSSWFKTKASEILSGNH